MSFKIKTFLFFFEFFVIFCLFVVDIHQKKMSKKGETRENRAPSLANRKSIDPRVLKQLAEKAREG